MKAVVTLSVEVDVSPFHKHVGAAHHRFRARQAAACEAAADIAGSEVAEEETEHDNTFYQQEEIKNFEIYAFNYLNQAKKSEA